MKGFQKWLIEIILVAALNYSTADTVTNMIEDEGYLAEQHFVETKDGYILGVYRVVNGSLASKPNKKVIFMMHGLFASAPSYLVMGKNRSAGFYFADRGYDVWLGNARGNTFSRNHTTLDPNWDQQFWEFTWHEIGVYDLPAMIDFILEKTNQSQLSYVGHSQGTTSAFVMLSTLPEYNDKIKVLHGMTFPIIFKYNSPIFVRSFLEEVGRDIPIVEELIKLTRNFELSPYSPSYKNWGAYCKLPVVTDICRTILFLLNGPGAKNYFEGMPSVLATHCPAGASYKQVLHYLQIALSGKFHNYDHGEEDNMELYGQTEPLEYNLTNINTKIHMIYGTEDWLNPEGNIPLLTMKIASSIVAISRFEEWNHIDFVFGKNVVQVQKEIQEIENRFD